MPGRTISNAAGKTERSGPGSEGVCLHGTRTDAYVLQKGDCGEVIVGACVRAPVYWGFSSKGAKPWEGVDGGGLQQTAAGVKVGVMGWCDGLGPG